MRVRGSEHSRPQVGASLRVRSRVLSYLWPMVIAALMVGVAQTIGGRAVIFPEGAALAFGIGTLALPTWTNSPARVAILPPLAAAAGVVIARLGIPGWSGELVALVVGLGLLVVARSGLIPVVSAAMLPSVFAVYSWWYPLAVLAISFALAGLARWWAPQPEEPSAGGLSWSAVAVGGAIAAGWIALGGAWLALLPAAFAPPMFVSILEWVGRPSAPPRLAAIRVAELVAGGGLGMASVRLVPSRWAAALLAVALTLLLMRILKDSHPPALAMSLVPQLVTGISAWAFCRAVATGAFVLYALAHVLRVTSRRDRQPGPVAVGLDAAEAGKATPGPWGTGP